MGLFLKKIKIFVNGQTFSFLNMSASDHFESKNKSILDKEIISLIINLRYLGNKYIK